MQQCAQHPSPGVGKAAHMVVVAVQGASDFPSFYLITAGLMLQNKLISNSLPPSKANCIAGGAHNQELVRKEAWRH